MSSKENIRVEMDTVIFESEAGMNNNEAFETSPNIEEIVNESSGKVKILICGVVILLCVSPLLYFVFGKDGAREKLIKEILTSINEGKFDSSSNLLNKHKKTLENALKSSATHFSVSGNIIEVDFNTQGNAEFVSPEMALYFGENGECFPIIDYKEVFDHDAYKLLLEWMNFTEVENNDGSHSFIVKDTHKTGLQGKMYINDEKISTFEAYTPMIQLLKLSDIVPGGDILVDEDDNPLMIEGFHDLFKLVYSKGLIPIDSRAKRRVINKSRSPLSITCYDKDKNKIVRITVSGGGNNAPNSVSDFIHAFQEYK